MMRSLRRRFDQWVLAGRPQLIRLQTGDVIFIEVPTPLSSSELAHFRLAVEDAFGYHHEVFVLHSGATLTVVSDSQALGRR